MVGAYILITTRSGAEKDVLESLRKIKSIVNFTILYGEYDILAKIMLKDITELNDYLLTNIRPIQGIEKTTTLIIAT